jgi:hypothetical protein
MNHEGKEPGYIGAMLDAERRLVLVPLDPDRPWAAFRRMRSWMKRRKPRTPPSIGVFTAPPAGGRVIQLPARSHSDRR